MAAEHTPQSNRPTSQVSGGRLCFCLGSAQRLRPGEDVCVRGMVATAMSGLVSIQQKRASEEPDRSVDRIELGDYET